MTGKVSRKRFRWWHELLLLVLIVGVMLTAERLVPGFTAWRTQVFFSRHAWEFAILAVGMTLVVISGGIDLSVGSTMGLCAVTFGMLVQRGMGPLVASIGCLVVGIVCGAFNAVLVARLRIHPLIVTLASYAAYRGIAEGASQGAAYSASGSEFSTLALGTWLGLPIPGWIFVVLALVFGAGSQWTALGRSLYVMGNNELAARFAGVPVDRIKLLLYTLSGLLAGIATLVYVARFSSAKADVGRGFELDVITAVVVGGTRIRGGKGNLVGTALGLVLIHEMRLLVTRYWQMEELKLVIVGGLLITSTLIYQLIAKSRD